jgi:hypothetical protein
MVKENKYAPAYESVAKYRVIYEVEDMRGSCPLYKVGDRIVIDSLGSTEVINLKESSAVCLRVIDNMWNCLVWQYGSDRIVTHLSGVNGECRTSCTMPGEPYTSCGYVIFRIRREKLEKVK